VKPAAPEPARDWIAEAHLIARSAPGLGNPLDLTLEEFERHLVAAVRGGEIGGRG
jgi:hypothetical protein